MTVILASISVYKKGKLSIVIGEFLSLKNIKVEIKNLT